KLELVHLGHRGVVLDEQDVDVLVNDFAHFPSLLPDIMRVTFSPAISVASISQPCGIHLWPNVGFFPAGGGANGTMAVPDGYEPEAGGRRVVMGYLRGVVHGELAGAVLGVLSALGSGGGARRRGSRWRGRAA